MEKIKAKLAAWKRKILSFASRATLANSVIEFIPLYPMMNYALARACLNEIQKIQRDFI